MELAYYDRDGRPISEEQWQRFGRQKDYGRVDYTDLTRPRGDLAARLPTLYASRCMLAR
jgi:hypothetical protein